MYGSKDAGRDILCGAGQKLLSLILQINKLWLKEAKGLVRSQLARPDQVGPGPRPGSSLPLCSPASQNNPAHVGVANAAARRLNC